MIRHSASATAAKATILPSRNSCAEMLETYTWRIVFCSVSRAMESAARRGGNIERASTKIPGP